MSLTLHQPNLSTSSHPCGQSWHHTSNVDISLLLKPRERDDNESALASPVSPLRIRDHDNISSNINTNSTNDCDAIPSPPQSVARIATSSAPISTTSSKQHHQSNPQLSPSLAPPARTLSTTTTTSVIPAKRSASHLNPPPPPPHHHNTRGTDSHPAKKQSKWSPYEDSKIISLRAEGMKWEDISRHLPGRSAISCRLHYQNYLERRSEWDEDRKDRLARLYERFKQEMWSKIAEEMAIPWRAAEAMHWQIGEHDMARRAGVTPFSLTTTSSSAASHSGSTGGAVGSSRSGHHSRHMSRSTTTDMADLYPRMGAQQLPSLAELTAGLPAFHHPVQPLLPGPVSGYPYSHSYTHSHSHSHPDARTPGTPYSSGLPYPGQSMIPSPGSLRGADFFLKRS